MKRLIWAVPCAGLVALSVAAATASAGITGPCTAKFAGVNVANNGTGATSKPIKVAHDATVPLLMTAPGPLSRVKIVLSFAGFSWTAKDKPTTTTTYSDSISVKKTAKYGVGLYKVTGRGIGSGFTCSGSALIRVSGSPLASVAGIVALAVTILGGLGTGLGFLGGRGGLRPFRFGSSLVAGALGGIGVVAFLQQAGVVFPTGTVAIIGLAAGGGLGILTPLLGKMLGHGAGAAGAAGASGVAG